MPRHARIQSTTGIYHVMARGNNREDVFLDSEDFFNFIKNLFYCCQINERNLTSYPTEIYAFCVMNNHFHLLIKEDENGIAHFMRRLMVRYAQYFKDKYEHIGHLFQDRFKSVPVEDEEYLLATYRYIAMNPVKAKICALPEAYPWSSFYDPSSMAGDKIPLREQGQSNSGEGRLNPSGTNSGMGRLSPLRGQARPADASLWPLGQSPKPLRQAPKPLRQAPFSVDSLLTDLISPLPVAFTNQQLDEFVHSEQREIEPFPEKITETEAIQVMLNIAGITKPEDFPSLDKETQIKVCRYLKKLGLSTRQIAKITKLPRNKLAGWLDSVIS